MHKKEVGGIFFLTDNLRNTSRHRNSGNTRRTDKRIDLALGNDAHDLTEESTANRSDRKCRKTKANNENGFRFEEVCRIGSCTDRNTEKNGNDIHKLVLRSLGKSFCNTGNFKKVTKHKHADESCCRRKNDTNNQCNNDRENDFLGFGNSAKLTHNDRTLFLAGERLHDGRLNKGNESHIRICCYRNRAQKVGCKCFSNVNSGRSIRAADYTDRSSFGNGEISRSECAEESNKNAKLCSRTEKKALGVCDKGLKVSHGTNAKEYKRRINTELNA